MKKRNDFSTLSNKIAHKSVQTPIHDRFKQADEFLGVEETVANSEFRERVIRKSYALTKNDLDCIRAIKDKCLNQRVVLNDSHIIRLALRLVSHLAEDSLVKASMEIPKIPTGRPKGSKS